MSALFLLLSLAFAADSEIPVERLTALGLDTPTTSSVAPGWRAALPEGGLVKAYRAESEAEAIAWFEGAQRTAQSAVWPVVDLDLDADQSVGDGKASVLVRKGAVVLYVRDLHDQSAAWAAKILPVLSEG